MLRQNLMMGSCIEGSKLLGEMPHRRWISHAWWIDSRSHYNSWQLNLMPAQSYTAC